MELSSAIHSLFMEMPSEVLAPEMPAENRVSSMTSTKAQSSTDQKPLCDCMKYFAHTNIKARCSKCTPDMWKEMKTFHPAVNCRFLDNDDPDAISAAEKLIEHLNRRNMDRTLSLVEVVEARPKPVLDTLISIILKAAAEEHEPKGILTRSRTALYNKKNNRKSKRKRKCKSKKGGGPRTVYIGGLVSSSLNKTKKAEVFKVEHVYEAKYWKQFP